MRDDDYEPPGADDEPPLEGSNVRPIRASRPAGACIPHSDINAERALISAALNQPGVVDAVVAAGVAPEHFVGDTHAAVWRAICEVAADGYKPDAPTVSDRVRAAHQQVDEAELHDLQTTPLAYLSNAPRYADIVLRHATTRRARAVLEAASEQVRLGADPHEVLAKLGDALPAPPSNQGVPLMSDLRAVYEDGSDPVIPTVAARDDHLTCLLYGPGVNWLSGEPGKGKSMLALWFAAQELRRGANVVYLDFETTEQGIVSRLKEMGVTADEIGRMSYARRSGPWMPSELAELRAVIAEKQPSLLVIDAVAGAMEAESLDPDSNVDVERWVASIPMCGHAHGAAVLCVDHVTKSAENRGRWAIGAQRKLGRADLALTLEMHHEAGVGVTGFGRLVVGKDRWGSLAQYQRGKTIAEVAIASEVYEGSDGWATATIRCVLDAPQDSAAALAGTGPTWYMEQVSRILEAAGDEGMGIRQLRQAVGKQARWVDKAVEVLLMDGCIAVVPVKGKAKPYRSVRPYRQPLPAAAPRGPDDM